MYNLQCDKNFKKLLSYFFKTINTDVKINEFSNTPNDISFLRNIEDIPENYIPNGKYIVVNSDDKEILELIKGTENKIITCGMSTRSTVTFSSINEKYGVVCIQRSIKILNSSEIYPFELPFELCGKIIDEISLLMLLTGALICNAEINLLKKINL